MLTIILSLKNKHKTKENEKQEIEIKYLEFTILNSDNRLGVILSIEAKVKLSTQHHFWLFLKT